MNKQAAKYQFSQYSPLMAWLKRKGIDQPGSWAHFFLSHMNDEFIPFYVATLNIAGLDTGANSKNLRTMFIRLNILEFVGTPTRPQYKAGRKLRDYFNKEKMSKDLIVSIKDLTHYVKKTDLDAEYVKKADLPDMVARIIEELNPPLTDDKFERSLAAALNRSLPQ